MRDFKKSEVWQKAHQLNLLVYSNILPKFPNVEQFDMSSQNKRAGYSIPMNIVEDCRRFTKGGFGHFSGLALGSTHELEYCCLLCKDLLYIDEELYYKTNNLINEVKAMLIGLIKKLRE
ncbi:four helix bundle protein [Mucilaginibacter panaciglaebae]